MDAQNFKFAPKFPQNGFGPKFGIFGRKFADEKKTIFDNFPTAQNLGRGNSPLPLSHGANYCNR